MIRHQVVVRQVPTGERKVTCPLGQMEATVAGLIFSHCVPPPNLPRVAAEKAAHRNLYYLLYTPIPWPARAAECAKHHGSKTQGELLRPMDGFEKVPRAGALPSTNITRLGSNRTCVLCVQCRCSAHSKVRHAVFALANKARGTISLERRRTAQTKIGQKHSISGREKGLEPTVISPTQREAGRAGPAGASRQARGGVCHPPRAMAFGATGANGTHNHRPPLQDLEPRPPPPPGSITSPSPVKSRCLRRRCASRPAACGRSSTLVAPFSRDACVYCLRTCAGHCLGSTMSRTEYSLNPRGAKNSASPYPRPFRSPRLMCRDLTGADRLL